MTKNTGAIDYNSTANIGFTFKEAISLSISGDIEIEGLAAGQQKDSNSVEITVNTNSTSGYILTASVGDSTHNNSDLSLDATNKFASVATSASLSSLANNTWGYKTSENNSSWSNYSGLALYSADEMSLLREANARPATGSEKTYFKIGAKASSSIVSGDYSNILTFYAVAKVPVEPPVTDELIMQEVADWGGDLAEGDSVQAVDSRDGKTYWVTRLADGNIWMTQNLDFDIDESVEYNHWDTDLGWGEENYDEDATWTPDLSTYTDSGWDWSYTTPESYDPGELCWNGELNMDWDGTLDNMAKSCETEKHYHIGNYYNWTAAVAMNDSSEYKDYDYNVDQSICPAGWMLPISGENTGDGSFANLLDNYSQDLWLAPLRFVLGGYWYGISELVGSYGVYWSSVVGGSSDAFYLYFHSDGNVDPQRSYDRDYGFSVRCVARP